MLVVDVLKTKRCVHCSKATEMVRKIIKDLPNVKIKETYLDSPEGSKIALKYRIMSVPAFLIGGKLKFVGMPSENALRKAIWAELSK